MQKRIVIIGQGPVGKAIHLLLTQAKIKTSVECWDIDVKACPIRRPLEETVPRAEIVFLCVPSWAIRAAAKEFGKLLRKKAIVVSVSKGLDRTSEETVAELLSEVFPSHVRTALLSGPMLATELLEGKPGAAVIASSSAPVRKEIARVFVKTPLRLTESADMKGVALCGILKNVYSIGFGVAQALHPGDNFRGMFAQEVLAEMSAIVKVLGGKEETVCSYAGIGDLIATGFSKHSKNHNYGRTLVETGKKPDFDSEGSVSVDLLYKKLGFKARKFPIFTTIHSIVIKKKDPKTLLKFYIVK